MLRPVAATFAVTVFFLAMRGLWQIDGTAIRRVYLQAVTVTLVSALPAMSVFVAFGSAVPLWALLAVAVSAPVLWLAAVYGLRHDLSAEVSSALRNVVFRPPVRHASEGP